MWDSLPVGAADGSSAALTREQMAELIGGRAGAAMVFGEPVTADGLTIVPVARAGIGFGGADGGIIGGGTDIRPLGYIEIRDGVARYRPIRDIWGRVGAPLTALAAGAAASLAVRSLLDLRRRPRRF
ncbi:hypothetical protein DFR70_12332 [Nocardia tenerifensis]|uniref:Sporulation protein YtfJ n=2 Tax=Nocardia tenerifensis TaxID=228006 RepID=A0A318KBI0_9NOCA|nr:hypothetical protein DFR70_12332 [Nocardia tenerifensis]